MAIGGKNQSLVAALQDSAMECESVKQIIDIAATAEALAVTALGGAIDAAMAGQLALDDEQIQVLQAARFAEQAHYDFLVAAGAEALTLTFTLPDPAIVSDVPTFLTTVIGLEEAFIAAYMAAAQEFAIRGEHDLVKYAMQTAAVEGDHRAHARFYAISAGVLSGVPNNVAFETALFTNMGEAAAALQALGWIGGSGPELVYPGPGEIVDPGMLYTTV
jgi:hypothetical protein